MDANTSLLAQWVRHLPGNREDLDLISGVVRQFISPTISKENFSNKIAGITKKLSTFACLVSLSRPICGVHTAQEFTYRS